MIRALAIALFFGTPALAQSPTPRDAGARALVERAAATARRTETMRADLTQVLTNPRAGTTLVSRGEFLQQGPTRFAFRFTEPAEDRIVADGQVIWLYLPSTMKGQVLKLPAVAGAGLDLVGTLLRDPATRYTITGLGDTTIAGRRLTRVALLPKGSAPFTRAVLWLEPRTAEITEAEFQEPSGLVRRLTFSRIRRGGRLPADAFVFTPPPGVRVVDQAALMGGMLPPR
ncbi:MAG: LolA family protein [Gemmatimonadaceae bacterium]